MAWKGEIRSVDIWEKWKRVKKNGEVGVESNLEHTFWVQTTNTRGTKNLITLAQNQVKGSFRWTPISLNYLTPGFPPHFSFLLQHSTTRLDSIGLTLVKNGVCVVIIGALLAGCGLCRSSVSSCFLCYLYCVFFSRAFPQGFKTCLLWRGTSPTTISVSHRPVTAGGCWKNSNRTISAMGLSCYKWYLSQILSSRGGW